MSQLLFYGIALALALAIGIFIGNVLIRKKMTGTQKVAGPILLDIVRFMEKNKYKSNIDKPIIREVDLLRFIPKPPIGWPPPCDLTICIDRENFYNIVISKVGDFTLKIFDKDGVILEEKMIDFKKDANYRIYSLDSKVPLNKKVSLELSVSYKNGSNDKIILDEVIFK